MKKISNKAKGTSFENDFVALLGGQGYWAHRFAEAADGSQPCDVIGVKNGIAYLFDCKTCDAKTFSIKRLEENQIRCFEKWLACGNSMPMVAVKTKKGHIFFIPYDELKEKKNIHIYE